MPDHMPVDIARVISEAHDCRQVIVVAWDGLRSHVVTYGASDSDSDQAAEGGNRIKAALGWPATLRAESPKVAALKARIAELEAEGEG